MRHAVEILKQKLSVGIGSFFTGILGEADIAAAIAQSGLRLPPTIVHAAGDGMGVSLSGA